MTKLTSFEKSNFASIRSDFAEAMKSLEAKYGIKIDMNGITYNAQTFSAKITAAIVDGATSDLPYQVNAKWKADYTKSCFLMGFEVEDFGKIVNVGREQFYLVGAQARKPNLILQRLDSDRCVSVPYKQVTKA